MTLFSYYNQISTNTAGRNAAPPSLEEALDKAKLITRPPQPPTANDLIEAGIKPELYEKPWEGIRLTNAR